VLTNRTTYVPVTIETSSERAVQVGRMKYRKHFEDSWYELCGMASNGAFTPHQEQDIVCMLYHLCLKRLRDPNLIHAYSAHNFDLILGPMKGVKRKDQKHTHCLLSEVKFILKKQRKARRMEGARNDITRLSAEGDPTTRRLFAIFDQAKCMEPSDIEELRQHAGNVTVLYGPLGQN